MWKQIKQFLAAPVFAADEEKTRAAALLNPLILSMLVVDIIGVVATVLVFSQKLGGSIVVGVIFLALLTSKILLQWGRVRPAGVVFIAGVWLPISAVLVLAAGHHLIAVTYLTLTVVAGLVIGQGAAITLAIVSSLLYLGITIVDAMGIPLPVLFPDLLTSNWVVLSLALALTVVPLNLALRSLGEALARARAYAVETDEQRRQLESLVSERTAELGRRTAYLGATTAIARELSFIQHDAPELFARVVKVVAGQFGFYHAGLFLLDEEKEWAVLRAASSAGGQRMLLRGHRLRVGAEGIVGSVAGRGLYWVAQDVGADAIFFNNPDLPETRSETALPLRVRGVTIGVLDVQSTEPAAFSAEDVTVLQALADQVAVAIDSVRLFQQEQERMASERRAYGELAREAWQEVLRARPDLAFASDASGIASFAAWEPQMKVAAQTGQVARRSDAPDVLALPIRVREQVVGVIDGRKPGGAAWTQDEIDLLQTLTEQLSAALEGAQLYEDTQRRAAREQVAREITSEMRRSLDVTTVLQTAISQLRTSLDLTEAEVWIEGVSSEAPPLIPPSGGD